MLSCTDGANVRVSIIEIFVDVSERINNKKIRKRGKSLSVKIDRTGSETRNSINFVLSSKDFRFFFKIKARNPFY